jgi:hypothetical protein
MTEQKQKKVVTRFPKTFISPDGHYKVNFDDIEPILLARLNRQDTVGYWAIEDGFHYFPQTRVLDTKNMDWNSNGGLLCICGYNEDTGEIKFFNLGILMPELEIFKHNNAKGCGYAVIDGQASEDVKDE